MSKSFWFLLAMSAVVLIVPVSAQPAGPGDPAFRGENAPEHGQGLQGQRPGPMGQPGHGMRPGMKPGMRPQGSGMGPQGGPEQGQGFPPHEGGLQKGFDPEMQKMMERHNSAMAMAEAHKQLSYVYEKQGKIDEAASELKKILVLMSTEAKPGKNPERERQMISGKLVPVYHEIARLYLQNDRIADAEKIINEGVEKFSTDDPAAASRLLLHLGEIYKSSNDLDKAAVNYKRVIEMNQKVLDKK